MADPVRPLRLGAVIWFGSLEFMSLGYEYDMVLLPPRAPPTDDDITHSSPGAGGAWAAALIALIGHDTSGTTPTPCKFRVTLRAPPVSHTQLLVQSPWLGTCLA